MTDPVLVRLASSSVAGAKVRTVTYNGNDCIVVPVIALVGDIVVQGLLSDGPEFIPADALSATPNAWSGRPVVAYHPINDDGSMANTPSNWESIVFGQAFNPSFSDNRLRMDLYLDRAKAEIAGPDAIEVIEKAEAGEMFEVSIGAWAWTENTPGTSPSGDHYDSRWIACVPDHVAVGLQVHGGKGACSNEMGCGGPRTYSALTAAAATQILMAQKERTPMPTTLTTPTAPTNSFAHRLSSLLSKVEPAQLAAQLAADLGQSLGESYSELLEALSRALRATVPGFLYVWDIYPDSNTAIYVAMPGDSYDYYRCKYSEPADGEDGDMTTSLHKKVEPTTSWTVVAKADEAAEPDKANITDTPAGDPAPSAVAASSPCQCRNNSGSEGTLAQLPKETVMPNVAELAGRLIACSAAKFTEADRPKLEQLSEDQLTCILAAHEKAATPQPPPVEPPKPDPNVVQLSKDEHAQLVRLANREEQREKAERASLITALAKKQRGYSQAQLEAKDTDDLRALALALDVEPAAIDMTGRLGALATATTDDTYRPRDSWGVAKTNLGAGLGLDAQ